MAILQQKDQQAVQRRFEIELKSDVAIRLYTLRTVGGLFIPGRECKSCAPTEQLLKEVSALSSKIHLDVVDYYGNVEEARAKGIDKIPAIVVGAGGGDNVRLYGLPSGFEFAVLLDTIVASSDRRSSLQLETRRRLKRLREDVHIQVFVTPA